MIEKIAAVCSGLIEDYYTASSKLFSFKLFKLFKKTYLGISTFLSSYTKQNCYSLALGVFRALFVKHDFLKCFQKVAHLRGCVKTTQNIWLLKLVNFLF